MLATKMRNEANGTKFVKWSYSRSCAIDHSMKRARSSDQLPQEQEPDADSSGEGEEVYVLLELPAVQGTARTRQLAAGTRYSLLGLEGAEPVLQLGDSFYRGAIGQGPGTQLVFARQPAAAEVGAGSRGGSGRSTQHRAQQAAAAAAQAEGGGGVEEEAEAAPSDAEKAEANAEEALRRCVAATVRKVSFRDASVSISQRR